MESSDQHVFKDAFLKFQLNYFSLAIFVQIQDFEEHLVL